MKNLWDCFGPTLCAIGLVGFLFGLASWDNWGKRHDQVSIPASAAPGFILVHQRSEGVYLAVQKIVTFSKYADGTRLDLMDGSVVMVGESVDVLILMIQNAEKK